MVAPAHLCKDFYILAEHSMDSLLNCGFCDDDQTIALMSYYNKPNLFMIHNVNYWFGGIIDFGGEHFHFDKSKKFVTKKYQEYAYRARILIGDGHYKLAIKYIKMYIKEKCFKKV